MEYTEGGEMKAKTVLLSFHGLFSVGDSSGQEDLCKKLKIHCISPTLPGWAKSTPWPKGKPIKEYADDCLALLTHILKDLKGYKIYTFGGSYGTVFAQIAAGNLECVQGMLICG